MLTDPQDDPVASISAMLQSLRLWNRAFDNLCRLTPSSLSSKKGYQEADNPFLTTSNSGKRNARSAANAAQCSVPNPHVKSHALSGIWWRIADGLMNTLFSLTQAYIARGSPREAEFFAQQAKDLSSAMSMPAMTSRALARLGEIYLHLGELNESHTYLTEAATLIPNAAGPDGAEIRRLHAEYNRLKENKKEAQHLYNEAIAMLEELEQQFVSVDAYNAMYASTLYPMLLADISAGPGNRLGILRNLRRQLPRRL